ncbi:hypothetical protein K0M31_019671 [Melipona bicolor]|uniref:Uncharacterized protein n=1 Tax=Melipona bicolor TaxID=60889 RepID=A0AA40G2V4_9HYME|nr:hypothetical protein K0M31_019671 [Melipona bicolor]
MDAGKPPPRSQFSKSILQFIEFIEFIESPVAKKVDPEEKDDSKAGKAEIEVQEVGKEQR